MSITFQHGTILLFIWIAYFVLHSLLASLPVKHYVASRCGQCMVFYRLLFNISAILLLFVPLLVSSFWRSEPLWEWSGTMSWVMNMIALVAIITFGITLKYYDMSEFLGLRQIRDQETAVEDQENFQLSPFHHFVRHPWYFLAIIIIWTRSMDVMMLISATAMTLYFIIGSKLEERKLISYHGDIYHRYKQRVPGIFPLPWKYLPVGEQL